LHHVKIDKMASQNCRPVWFYLTMMDRILGFTKTEKITNLLSTILKFRP
jgi:hypothetical protein